MELDRQKKLVSHIFRLLKVNEIVIPIGRTNKGNLGIKFSASQEDFEIYLDAVPLSTKDMLADDNNIELKKMLEKYLFENKSEHPRLEQIARIQAANLASAKLQNEAHNILQDAPKKQRGRPAGSKNKGK